MRVGIVAQEANPRAASLAETLVQAIEAPAVDMWGRRGNRWSP